MAEDGGPHEAARRVGFGGLDANGAAAVKGVFEGSNGFGDVAREFLKLLVNNGRRRRVSWLGYCWVLFGWLHEDGVVLVDGGGGAARPALQSCGHCNEERRRFRRRMVVGVLELF